MKEMDWPDQVHRTLKAAGVRQVGYVPDAGHKRLIELCIADRALHAVVLSTEEEGIGLAAGAWLGGMRGAYVVEQCQPVAAGQLHVAQHQLRPLDMQLRQRGFSRSHRSDAVTRCRQADGQQPKHVGVVVNHQQMRRRVARCGGGGRRSGHEVQGGQSGAVRLRLAGADAGAGAGTGVCAGAAAGGGGGRVVRLRSIALRASSRSLVWSSLRCTSRVCWRSFSSWSSSRRCSP